MSRLLGTELRASIRGPVWEIGDEAYDATRTVWNGAVDHGPAIVARCADVEDVQSTLRAAGRFDLPVSVRGGGHDWAGRAIREGGLVVDLSAMRGVRIDPTGALAEVQGGALAGEPVLTITRS